MADIELPELPPLHRFSVYAHWVGEHVAGSGHIADQMTAYGLACYRVSLEKAAEICAERIGGSEADPDTFAANEDLRQIIAAIRSLMKEPK